MLNLKNKIAVITGGGRGMGKTHALALAKAGAKVVVSDISEEECLLVADEIKKQGKEAIALKCDVSKKEEVNSLIKKTIDKWGKIDILINNAGIAEFKPFLEMTEEEWDRTININLKGYFLCARAAAEEMAKHKFGIIVNIGSVAMGQVGIGFPSLVHYVASKGGIAAMTEALALDLAPYNIRVNAIAPGIIDTPMVDPIREDEQGLNATLARIPMKRMGKPEEISNVVLFLCSDLSSYMTGTVIPVDGGWLAG